MCVCVCGYEGVKIFACVRNNANEWNEEANKKEKYKQNCVCVVYLLISKKKREQ